MGSGARREIGIEIGGKTYTVRELDLDGYGEVENFVKTKRARLFRESAGNMPPKKVNEEVVKIIRTNITGKELGEESQAIDCGLFIAYLAMRHNQGITRENIAGIVGMETAQRVSDILDAMEDDDEVNPPEAETESP